MSDDVERGRFVRDCRPNKTEAVVLVRKGGCKAVG